MCVYVGIFEECLPLHSQNCRPFSFNFTKAQDACLLKVYSKSTFIPRNTNTRLLNLPKFFISIKRVGVFDEMSVDQIEMLILRRAEFLFHENEMKLTAEAASMPCSKGGNQDRGNRDKKRSISSLGKERVRDRERTSPVLIAKENCIHCGTIHFEPSDSGDESGSGRIEEVRGGEGNILCLR